jgi:hypothetical protein
VQLLPLTDINAAHTDFVNVRLNGVDTSGDPQYDLLPTSQMQHSPVSEKEKKEMYQEMILSRWPYIFAGCFALVIILLGCCIWRCCCRRRRQRLAAAKKERQTKTASFLAPKGDDTVYVALEEQGGRGYGAYGDSQYSLAMQDQKH